MAAAAPEKKPQDDNIRVFLRVRPPVGRELKEGPDGKKHTFDNLQPDPTDPTALTLTAHSGGPQAGTKKFHFHRVFGQQADQQDVYEHYAKENVDHAMNGFSSVLFVYGQTGSGKTHTISNTEKGQEGVLPRAVQELWQRVNTATDYDYTVSVSFVQLYQELLTDMLADSKEEEAVRLSGVTDRRHDIQVVTERSGKDIARPVNSAAETLDMFTQGNKKREQASTQMNAQSSRSHTCFIITVKRNIKSERQMTVGGDAPVSTEGKLIICDLAGSERVKKTEAAGKQLQEAASINSALLVLGRVVAALTDKKKQQMAPFRESKLTRLLQYSLSGWGKTSIVVNVSPSDDNTDETLSAIQFGQRAIQIKQEAQQHTTPDYKALYMGLQKDLDQRRDALVASTIEELEAKYAVRIKDYEEKISDLENEIKGLRGAKVGVTPSPSRGQPAGAAAAAAAAPGVTPPSTTPSVEFTAADGSGGSFALESERDMDAVIQTLKSRLEGRDQRLRAMDAEFTVAKAEKADAEYMLFGVSRKFKDFKARMNFDFLEKETTIQDLTKRLAAAQGTEYLSVNAKVESSATGALTADSSSDALAQCRVALAAGGGDASALEAAVRAISVLEQDLASKAAYNDVARRALKMVARDLDDASLKLGIAAPHGTVASPHTPA